MGPVFLFIFLLFLSPNMKSRYKFHLKHDKFSTNRFIGIS
jgi:hypothetical protein